MSQVGEPVSTAVPSDRRSRREPGGPIARCSPHRFLLGDIDHRVTLGVLEKQSPILFGGAQEQVILVEHAPSRVARACRALFQSSDGTRTAVQGDVTLGFSPEQVDHHTIGEPIDSALMLNRVFDLARNQFVALDQADGAVAGQRRAGFPFFGGESPGRDDGFATGEAGVRCWGAAIRGWRARPLEGTCRIPPDPDSLGAQRRFRGSEPPAPSRATRTG